MRIERVEEEKESQRDVVERQYPKHPVAGIAAEIDLVAAGEVPRHERPIEEIPRQREEQEHGEEPAGDQLIA